MQLSYDKKDMGAASLCAPSHSSFRAYPRNLAAANSTHQVVALWIAGSLQVLILTPWPYLKGTTPINLSSLECCGVIADRYEVYRAALLRDFVVLGSCKIAIAAHLKAFEHPLTNVEPVILAKIVIFRLSRVIGWPWLSSLGKRCGHFAPGPTLGRSGLGSWEA